MVSWLGLSQDDENGWQLRVAPEREPAEERGEWTRYAAAGDDGSGAYPGGDDLFYNAVTGEIARTGLIYR